MIQNLYVMVRVTVKPNGRWDLTIVCDDTYNGMPRGCSNLQCERGTSNIVASCSLVTHLQVSCIVDVRPNGWHETTRLTPNPPYLVAVKPRGPSVRRESSSFPLSSHNNRISTEFTVHVQTASPALLFLLYTSFSLSSLFPFLFRRYTKQKCAKKTTTSNNSSRFFTEVFWSHPTRKSPEIRVKVELPDPIRP